MSDLKFGVHAYSVRDFMTTETDIAESFKKIKKWDMTKFKQPAVQFLIKDMVNLPRRTVWRLLGHMIVLI